MSGIERQPSSALSFALLRSTISGLMTTSGSPSISITASRSGRPTCGAASRIPPAWCIVSNMSATRRRISSVTFGTGVVAWRRIGSPRTRMSRMLTAPRSLLGWRARAADDARDLAALDDETRLRGLDRDLVLHRTRRRAFARGDLADVYYLAEDATKGDDPIAALDRAERLLVLLLLLRLRADEEEVEDAQDQDDLDEEGRERAHAASAAAELEQEERGENARVDHAGAGTVRE